MVRGGTCRYEKVGGEFVVRWGAYYTHGYRTKNEKKNEPMVWCGNARYQNIYHTGYPAEDNISVVFAWKVVSLFSKQKA